MDKPHVDPELESISSMIHGESVDIGLFSTNLTDYLTLDIGDDYRIPASWKTIIDWLAYPNFGIERKDAFFGQKQQLFDCNGQHGDGGGVRGISWGTLKTHKHLYDSDHITSGKDNLLLFNITDLLSNIPCEQKVTLFDIMGSLTDKGTGTDCDLKIPNDPQTAK